MDTLFAVFRKGLRSSECAGIFSTFELSKEAAYNHLKTKCDNCHEYYVVIPFELPKDKPRDIPSCMDETKALLHLRRVCCDSVIEITESQQTLPKEVK